MFTGVFAREHASHGSTFPRAIRKLRLLFGQFLDGTTLAVVLVLVTPLTAFAQGTPVLPRVVDRVDATRLAVLSGNTHPLARAQNDQGAAPPDLPMNRIMLVLKRSPEQESTLQDLLVEQQTTSAANFHKWLTPAQFGQQFGPADADIQAVTSWLASFGFQGIKVSNGRTVIEFSGTAAQVETALHTPIHRYVVNGESHWANANDPQIPDALAPVVSGFSSLHDFRPKPTVKRSGRTVTGTVTPGVKPQINLTNSQNQLLHALVPGDFNTIYNVGPAMTGSGVTIGVIAVSNINVQDVADFRNLFGLSPMNPQVILNGPDPGDVAGSDAEFEALLDATWVGSVAPMATVDLVVSEDTNAASGNDLSEVYIVDNNLADVMTESFGSCEANFTLSGAQFYSNLAEQAAAQGITYVVASGDGGPDGCDDQTTIPAKDSPASVSILASTPFTVAVGGTEFNDTLNPSTYWNTTNAADGASAKSYIPENVWNESCTALSATCPIVGLWSSGGGASTIFLTAPPWQSGVTGLPASHPRLVPDVAMDAADHDGYLVCADGSCEGSNQTFFIASGTSASAQSFGGVMALVVQQVNGRVGLANYSLYKLAAAEAPTSPANSSCNGSNTSGSPASTCIFNDITVGNTNIPGETGFSAALGPGYDEATGLGSVNVSNLVNKWSTAVVKASTTTLTLNGGSAVRVTHGTSIPVSITVVAKAPATGTPTGDVSLIATNGSGAEIGADGFPLSSGIVNSTTTLLPGGTYTVTAHYGGDGTFTGSDSTPGINVTVTPEASKTGLGIVTFAANGTITSTNATSIVYGAPYILHVSVTNAAGVTCNPSAVGGPACPTGTVSLTDGVNPLDGGSFKLNALGYFEDQPIQLPAGPHSISAAYAGDNSFNASTSPTDVVSVSQAATTTSLAASQTTVATGTAVTLTATVVTQSNAIANALQEPTGNVQFFLNGSPLGGGLVEVTGGVNSNTMFAQATASISPVLANGSDAITAQYIGDSNYAGSPSVSNTVTITVGSAGINLTPASNTATINVSALGAPGTQTITVSAAGGFTGTVNLTCAVTKTMIDVTDPPTCSFASSPTITLTSITTSGTDTLDFNTMAASAIFKPVSRPQGPGPGGLLLGEICATLACMFLLGFAAKKRRGAVLLATAILAVVAIGASCGGGSGGGGGTGGGNPGTTAGAYSVTVTATPSSGTAQSTVIAVNVP
jgi:hypothetical protein